MTTADEGNGWVGGTLLGDHDENSEIYRHYAELCQVRKSLAPVTGPCYSIPVLNSYAAVFTFL